MAYKAVKQAADAMDISFSQYVKEGPDPMAVAVLLEDAAAVFGVMMASTCIGLFVLTGNPIWDAIGSILIAILLGAVAIFLVIKNRKALLGQAIHASMKSEVIDVLESDAAVDAVHNVKATVMGADSFRFKAEIDFNGAAIAQQWLADKDLKELHDAVVQDPAQFERFLLEYGEHICEALGDEIDRIEARIQEAVPSAKFVDLEAD